MYVFENESAVEKWHKENNVPMLQCKNSEELLHEMGLSKYPVERAFDELLTHEQRETIKAKADIEPFEDYIRPDLSGGKLRHYNYRGLEKLARGLREIVDIRAPFPKTLRLSDFFLIDPYTRGQL